MLSFKQTPKHNNLSTQPHHSFIQNVPNLAKQNLENEFKLIKQTFNLKTYKHLLNCRKFY